MTPAASVQPGPAGVSVVVTPALTGRLLAFVAHEVDRLRRQEGRRAHSDVLDLLDALRTAEGANARLRAAGTFAGETQFAAAGADPGCLLSMVTVAEALGCSPQWACVLARRGELPGARRHGRIWLVPAAEVALLAAARRRGAA